MDKWVAENIGLSRCKTRLNSSRRSGLITATCILSGHLPFYGGIQTSVLKYHADDGREHFETAPFTTGLKRLPYRSCRLPIKRLYGKHASLLTALLLIRLLYLHRSFRSCTTAGDKLPRPQHLWQPELIEIFERN